MKNILITGGAGFIGSNFVNHMVEKYGDKYSYIVYYFDQEKEKLEILKEYKGKNKNEINEERKNCYICSNGTKKYKKVDKYIMALAKLYEKEDKLIKS